jgi:hypothetical protein
MCSDETKSMNNEIISKRIEKGEASDHDKPRPKKKNQRFEL